MISDEMIEEAAREDLLDQCSCDSDLAKSFKATVYPDLVQSYKRKLRFIFHALRKQVLEEAAKIAKTLTPHQGPLAIYDECRRHGELISEAIRSLIEKPSP